ncbi:MAG: hypothetical protein LBB26_01215 [Puniceicoccales bacterium]|jgi:hypothetical protein|nr:hypothetical protein [Puniceicoccales bacterium]
MMCSQEDQTASEENVDSGGITSGGFSFKTAWSDDNDLTTRDSGANRDGRSPRDGRDFAGPYAGNSRARGNFDRPGGGARDGFQRRPTGSQGERRGGFDRSRRDFNAPRPGQTPHYRRPSGDGPRRDSDGANRGFPGRNSDAGSNRFSGRSFGGGANRFPRREFDGGARRFPRRGEGFQSQRREFIPPPETDYTISFYATEEAFKPVAKRLHQSGKTYETFALAREFLANPEHYVFVLRKNPEATSKFYYSPLDGIPFSSKDEAIGHLLRNRLEELFDVEISEGEAPTGTFPTIVLCPYTKKPIAAPNHHSYKKLLNEHYMVYIHGVPFDRFCQKLETSSAPEDISAWKEAMRKNRRFKVRRRPVDGKSFRPECNGEVPDEGSANPEVTDPVPAESSKGEPVQTEFMLEKSQSNVGEVVEEVLQSLLEVREYLEKHIDDYVNATECIRVPGTSLELIQDKDLRNFVRYHLGRQQRFPLETANGMRMKFKQNNLHSYKTGKNGISYVCTVPRKFRSREADLTDKLELLLDTIEKFPLSTANVITQKVVGETFGGDEVANLLTWLIREGYVTEFENGTLITHSQVSDQEQNRRPNASDPRKKEERMVRSPRETQILVDEAGPEESAENIPAGMQGMDTTQPI